MGWSKHLPTLIPALLLWFVFLPVSVSGNSLERLLAPKAEPWERWQQYQASDQRQIDHESWNGFLNAYVTRYADGVMRIAYARVTSRDKAALRDYIAGLSELEISGYARSEQFAYWVNLYNALTVQVVLEHYPVMSIRDIDISPGLFADGPWRKTLITAQGENISLDDIEHRILRPGWGDPRIHYAVNCASIGCPDLQPEAFTAANTERLLEQAARDYINHPRGVRANRSGVTLSSIYNWFASDFDQAGGVLEHIRRYATADLKARLEGIETIDGYTYDWSLNDKPPQDD
jgi:hypothetical protein